jgi:hypothetical protein
MTQGGLLCSVLHGTPFDKIVTWQHKSSFPGSPVQRSQDGHDGSQQTSFVQSARTETVRTRRKSKRIMLISDSNQDGDKELKFLQDSNPSLKR